MFIYIYIYFYMKNFFTGNFYVVSYYEHYIYYVKKELENIIVKYNSYRILKRAKSEISSVTLSRYLKRMRKKIT